jgi:riboflavin synthase
MFTGLVEKKGILTGIASRGNGLVVRISAGDWDESLTKGESIAVNGTCLTVSQLTADTFEADVLKETLEKTSLKNKRPGTALNLERALRSGDRIGGHMVSGHVDGIGTVASIKKTGFDYIVRISCKKELMREVVTKGSVTLDGVSLTVSAVGDNWLEVNVIPHTWRETTFSDTREGSIVNIETDMIAKYVRKFMQDSNADASILEKMKRAGFP